MRRAALVLTAAVGCLVSCDQASNRVSTLWTNVPEMASYAEKYNASQKDWQILVEYQEDPVPLLLTPGRKADLVVARGLASKPVKDTMVPLDFLFDGGNLAKASFYRRILEPGQGGDRFKLLPVSFDLPVLLFSKTVQPDLPGFSISTTGLLNLNQSFENAQTRSPDRRRLAFSPRWAGFSLPLLQMRGAGFQEGFQGNLEWDSAALAEGLGQLQSWPSPGWAAVADFHRKYLQSDPFPALNAGRVQFFPSTLANFLARPWEERRDLDFRFVDEAGRVTAADTTVWAGIPSSSLTRGAAERFLAWFFQAETQKQLIRDGRSEDPLGFGLARGLSSLLVPNTTSLIEVYPEMTGRVPASDQVSFWPALPSDWEVIKRTVLLPWLEKQTSTEKSLKEALAVYQTQVSRN